jgi:two-component system response regulator VicR
VVDLLTFLMERDGHKVVRAYDGKACLELVDSEKPDLILLDVMMPEMDGYTVFTRLNENEETRQIPVIVLTAKGGMREVFQQSANIAGYVNKPFEPALLQARVKAVLELRAP